MTPPRFTSPQAASFDIESDHGVLVTTVPYFNLVSDQFTPESVSHSAVGENENWSFDLTYRSVYRRGSIRPTVKPMFPEEFAVEEVSVREGRIGGAPNYIYKDHTYKLTLVQTGFGIHKALVVLPSSADRSKLEVPIVWERVPFLTTTPSRVSLGTRAVRVFVRCPDDSVELTRLLKVPPGTKAVIASPRELIVSATDDSPSVIDGSIEIETTAKTNPVLSVKIVRYVATQQQSSLLKAK